MRLLHCQLQNVRLHEDLELSFSPKLTLIGGPNESGKSTLVEALHRALFLKASATGAPVEALQSRLHIGQPVVQISFEARGDTWTLRKRFSGSTGQVSLQAGSGGASLSGPRAEELLAELLGVGEIVGSRQAGTVLPSRWAHLWVRQGLSGDDLLSSGRSGYDFDQLRLQLERSGGAAVQQSALDQQVEQSIAAALAENFTSRGTRKNSPLHEREEAQNLARMHLSQALTRLHDYESASDQLATLTEELERLQGEVLPDLLERRSQLQKSAEAAGRLDSAIELAARALEPIRLRHHAAGEALRRLDGLQAEINQRQKSLAALEARAAAADGRQAALEAAEQQHRQTLAALSLQRQGLEQRQRLLQRLLERTSTAESLARFAAELTRRRMDATARRNLEQQLSGLPGFSRPELLELRQLEQQLRDAHTRRQAMAAGVKVLRADQPVNLNGQPLQEGDEQRLSRVFQLQVGDGVVLEITPGGGQALEDLDHSVQSAAGELKARLEALGVAGVAAAEELLEQRTALEQQRAARQTAVPADLEQLERQQDGLEQRLAALDAELLELAEVRRELEQEQPLPHSLSALQTRQQQSGAAIRPVSAALEVSERELEATRSALQEFQQQRIREAGAIKAVGAELADRRQRLEQQIQREGDRDAVEGQLKVLSQELQRAEAELTRLNRERAGLSGHNSDREQQRLTEQIEGLSRRQEELLDQRGAAKQRCDSISREDPFAAVEQARLQLETAEAEHHQLLRLTQAHQLLQQLFQEAQTDLSSRYSEPLARSIADYLRPLVPDGQVVRLNYDPSKGFEGLQLRRNHEFYPFETLSGGMREQLAAALRLSMADVLKEAHDGCLPLVFDDAFTNSDPDRVDLVKRMLGTAVERGLQVILLTCDPTAYGSFADQMVELR
ncbi:MAG: AAA family ATPase [Cyanobacteriota bacterium]|nr:AAA family ATPase [Cyanobacteriota bacterium]